MYIIPIRKRLLNGNAALSSQEKQRMAENSHSLVEPMTQRLLRWPIMLRDAIEQIAHKRRRSTNYVILAALRSYVARENGRNKDAK